MSPVWLFPGASEALEDTGLVPVPVEVGAIDHVTEALDRLPSQFRDKPGWIKTITVLCAPVQRIENAIRQLLTLRSIGTARGAQLDLIGRIVREPRQGEPDDEVYRRRLRARIRQKLSRGRVEDLIAVSVLLLNDEAVRVVVDQQGAAAVVVRLEDEAVATAVAELLVRFLRESVGAGVRLILESSAEAPEDAFRFATCDFLDDTYPSMESVIAVRTGRAVLFPAQGQLRIGRGTANEEVVAYVSRSATTFTLDGLTAEAHDAGELVELEPPAGRGYPITIGGTFTVSSENEEPGGVTITVPVAAYESALDLLSAITPQLPSTWSVATTLGGRIQFDKSPSDSGEWISVEWNSVALRTAMGFAADVIEHDPTGSGGGPATAPNDPTLATTPGGVLSDAME